jgi:hypothetical protein
LIIQLFKIIANRDIFKSIHANTANIHARSSQMTRLNPILITAIAASIILSGCAGAGPARIEKAQKRPDPLVGKSSLPLSMAQNGILPIAPHVYVDQEIPAESAIRLLNIVNKARVRAAYFYGELISEPDILFCSTMECYRKFGAIGLGYTLGNTILISPYGNRAAIVSHEISHVELAARLGGQPEIMDKIPQWFDEGTAVMVSQAHEFSDEAWLDACHNGESSPRLDEIESVNDWNRVTGANGINMQRSYGTARQEVLRWYAKAGGKGLDKLIHALHNRENFHDVYRSIEENS